MNCSYITSVIDILPYLRERQKLWDSHTLHYLKCSSLFATNATRHEQIRPGCFVLFLAHFTITVQYFHTLKAVCITNFKVSDKFLNS